MARHREDRLPEVELTTERTNLPICPVCRRHNAMIGYPDSTWKCRDCGYHCRAKRIIRTDP